MTALPAMLALFVLAQTPQTASPARDGPAIDILPSGTASLAGVVVDHERKPVRRASITITGAAPFARTVVTDDDGRFTFPALPAGRYTITGRKGGYPQMSYGAKEPFRTGSGVVVGDGQALEGLTLMLARGAAIEGTVYDERGEAMPGVPMMAWEVRTSLSGERVFTFPRVGGVSTTTDDRGRYRIFGLPPGEYTVGTSWAYSSADVRVPTDDEIRAAFAAASAPSTSGAPAGGRGAAPPPPAMVSYSRIWHPDSIDPMDARTMTLGINEERNGIDVRMRLVPMSRIEATVLEIDGAPVQGAEVSLIRRSRIEALNSTTVSSVQNGQYRTRSLSQGDYGLVITAAASGDRPARSASMPITISSPEPLQITVTLQPQPPVTGRVVFTGEALRPPNATTVRVSLSAAPGSFGNWNSQDSSVSAEGLITVTGVTPARYRVTASVPNQPASGPHAWTLHSALADGRDVTDLPFEIAPGAPPTLTLTFTDQIAELSGRLVQPSGQPGTDFFVVVLPGDRQYWLPGTRRIVSARPDVSGRYTFRGLPPGNYQIAVTTELDSQDLSDASVLEKLVATSVPVTLGVAEKKTFDIRLGGG